MINLAGAVTTELRMLEDDMSHVAVAVLQLPDVDGLGPAAKRDVQGRQVFGTRQRMQRPVGRGRDRNVPARGPERMWQVAYDVADAADLATGQGTVLRRQEYDRPGVDRCLPTA